MNNICPRCGKVITGDNYCPNCGTPSKDKVIDEYKREHRLQNWALSGIVMGALGAIFIIFGLVSGVYDAAELGHYFSWYALIAGVVCIFLSKNYKKQRPVSIIAASLGGLGVVGYRIAVIVLYVSLMNNLNDAYTQLYK